jgi:hypothetical protein
MNILLVGGHSKVLFEKKMKVLGVKVLFCPYDEKVRSANEVLSRYVRKSDMVVVVTEAVPHRMMWAVRDLAKEQNVPIFYQRGTGVTQSVEAVKCELFGEKMHA